MGTYACKHCTYPQLCCCRHDASAAGVAGTAAGTAGVAGTAADNAAVAGTAEAADIVGADDTADTAEAAAVVLGTLQSQAVALEGSSQLLLLHACQTGALLLPDAPACRSRLDSLQEERCMARSFWMRRKRGLLLMLSRRLLT